MIQPTIVPTDDVVVEVIVHDCRVRSGDTQSMSFAKIENSPLPPFYELNAPLKDFNVTKSDGTPSLTSKTKQQRIKKGYAGTAKGMKQVLWERGLYIDGMKADFDYDHPSYSTLSAKSVLHSCQDFKEEPTAMQALVRGYGHLIMFGAKGHPDLYP